MATKKRPTKARSPTKKRTNTRTPGKQATPTHRSKKAAPKKQTRARAAPKKKAPARQTTAKKGTPRKTTTKKTTNRRRQAPPNPASGAGSTIQPMLVVPDVDAHMRFLEQLGFQTTMTMPGPGGKTIHAVMNLGEAMIHLDPMMDPNDVAAMPGIDQRMVERARQVQKGPIGLGISLYVVVPDVDAVHNTLQRLGAQIVQPPKDQFWGDRTLTCTDTAGYMWSFAQHIKDVTPEEMAKAMEQMMAAPS